MTPWISNLIKQTWKNHTNRNLQFIFQGEISCIQGQTGQFMRFVFIRGDERVHVWEVGIDPRMIDIKKYCILLDRAIASLTFIFE